MTNYECETVINYNQEEPEATIYSCMQSVWKNCERLGLELKEEYKDRSGKVIAKTYCCPKKWIKIRKPSTRKYTEEQKERLREQMRKIHSKSILRQSKPSKNRGGKN